MPYTGDQLPNKRKLDKNGQLIDPEDTLLDDLRDMFVKDDKLSEYDNLDNGVDGEFEDLEDFEEPTD
tara:strand:- start:926 stop:1126 length:201 start_codon:yes stop_codon:yes gene_type:complete